MTLVFPPSSLLLWWVCPLLTDEPLQLSLSDKSFYLLLQVVAVVRIMAVITISRALTRISF